MSSHRINVSQVRNVIDSCRSLLSVDSKGTVGVSCSGFWQVRNLFGSKSVSCWWGWGWDNTTMASLSLVPHTGHICCARILLPTSSPRASSRFTCADLFGLSWNVILLENVLRLITPLGTVLEGKGSLTLTHYLGVVINIAKMFIEQGECHCLFSNLRPGLWLERDGQLPRKLEPLPFALLFLTSLSLSLLSVPDE